MAPNLFDIFNILFLLFILFFFLFRVVRLHFVWRFIHQMYKLTIKLYKCLPLVTRQLTEMLGFIAIHTHKMCKPKLKQSNHLLKLKSLCFRMFNILGSAQIYPLFSTIEQFMVCR